MEKLSNISFVAESGSSTTLTVPTSTVDSIRNTDLPEIYSPTNVCVNSIPCLSIDPTVVYFDNFQPGSEHKVIVEITNVSAKPQRIYRIHPTQHVFSIITKNWNVLHAGLTVKLEVRFRPMELKYFHDELKIVHKNKTLCIPIHAIPVTPTTNFPSTIELTNATIGQRLTCSFPLNCISPVDLSFKLDFKPRYSDLFVSPAQGCIRCFGEAVTITISYLPRMEMYMTLELILTVTNLPLPQQRCKIIVGMEFLKTSTTTRKRNAKDLKAKSTTSVPTKPLESTKRKDKPSASSRSEYDSIQRNQRLEPIISGEGSAVTDQISPKNKNYLLKEEDSNDSFYEKDEQDDEKSETSITSKGVEWSKRIFNFNRFVKAVKQVIVRNRAQKRLEILKKWIDEVGINEEKVVEKIIAQISSATSEIEVDPFSTALFCSSQSEVCLLPHDLDTIPAHPLTSNVQIPLKSITEEEPQYYQLMGLKMLDPHEGRECYVPVAPPLRAPDHKPCLIDKWFNYDVHQPENTRICLKNSLVPPTPLFQSYSYNTSLNFNPLPLVETYNNLVTTTEIDPAFILHPSAPWKQDNRELIDPMESVSDFMLWNKWPFIVQSFLDRRTEPCLFPIHKNPPLKPPYDTSLVPGKKPEPIASMSQEDKEIVKNLEKSGTPPLLRTVNVNDDFQLLGSQIGDLQRSKSKHIT